MGEPLTTEERPAFRGWARSLRGFTACQGVRRNEAETKRADRAEKRLARASAWIDQCLAQAARLEEATRQVPSPATAPAPAPAAPPRPLRPTPVPIQEHRCITVRAELRGQQGFRPNCICGWNGPLAVTEPVAQLDGQRHCDLVTSRQRQATAR